MSQNPGISFADVDLLASLPAGERQALAQKCRMRRYQAGEHIIDGQSDSRDFYIILEGTVRVANYALSGREVTLDDVGPGGYFGELAAIDGGPRSAFVMAQDGEVRVAAMPAEVFLDLMSSHPRVGIAIMRRLARMIRQATDRIMDLSTVSANARIYGEVLRMAWNFTSDGRVATIAPFPSHTTIASRVSTTRETVARALNGLVRRGIAKRQRNALLVPDMVRLATLIDELRNK